MKYGVTIFPTSRSVRPGEFAAAAEARGFESFWVPEHSHIPVSPMTPGPGEPGLPEMYYELHDPFVALAMAAETTREILLGTSICLVVQRDPIQTAKEVASLDQLSDGRFLFGVGGGWNAPEIAHHGVAFESRLAVMEERIAAMKQLWTQEKAEFDGEYVKFSPSFALPKPAQSPHPPIHVAANGPKGLGRVVRYGEGWFPLLTAEDPGGTLFDHLEPLRAKLRAAGRDPESVEVSAYWCPPDEDLVKRCRDEGVDRVILMVDPMGRDEALATLDRHAELAARVG